MQDHSATGRSRLDQGSTDPVVVGLGRLLVGLGALVLFLALSVGWLLLRCLS